MGQEHLNILMHLAAAWLAGGLIGLERSFHGRPAGFRTHALVCLASALLMLVTRYQGLWLTDVPMETVRTDPTRMAQGIMTGIGFLGAGVIFKEGLSVRGLTTAASIWMTAALGVLIGIGFYFPALISFIMALVTLSVFRWVELKMPNEFYAHHSVTFARDAIIPEDELRQLIMRHGFTISNMSYCLDQGGETFQYKMVIKTIDRENMKRLADTLTNMAVIREFRISPTGD